MQKIFVSVVFLAMACLTGCASRSDFATVGMYGGYATPQADNWLADMAPIEAVDFSVQRRVIDDDDFAALFPALKRLNPRRISLGGQKISDRSIDLLNQLDYLNSINLVGTDVTYQGKARLKLAHFE